MEWYRDGSAMGWHRDGSAVGWHRDGSAVGWHRDVSAVGWHRDGFLRFLGGLEVSQPHIQPCFHLSPKEDFAPLS